MAQFDFPNTPAIGDLFQDSSSGAVYRWNGYAWIGGVTGIGLQTIKETRYLVAGSYTFTRDPKSSGFGDIFLLGGMGGHVTQVWASGQIVCAGGGAAGSVGIKWKYALPATAPVLVGVSRSGSVADASSFDTVLVAPGGGNGGSGTAVSTANQTVGGGSPGGLPTGCDESYRGQGGATAIIVAGYSVTGVNRECRVFLRGIVRKSADTIASGAATIAAATGDDGAVIVVEYLNP